jgi:hypothetical protein
MSPLEVVREGLHDVGNRDHGLAKSAMTRDQWTQGWLPEGRDESPDDSADVVRDLGELRQRDFTLAEHYLRGDAEGHLHVALYTPQPAYLCAVTYGAGGAQTTAFGLDVGTPSGPNVRGLLIRENRNNLGVGGSEFDQARDEQTMLVLIGEPLQAVQGVVLGVVPAVVRLQAVDDCPLFGRDPFEVPVPVAGVGGGVGEDWECGPLTGIIRTKPRQLVDQEVQGGSQLVGALREGDAPFRRRLAMEFDPSDVFARLVGSGSIWGEGEFWPGDRP